MYFSSLLLFAAACSVTTLSGNQTLENPTNYAPVPQLKTKTINIYNDLVSTYSLNDGNDHTLMNLSCTGNEYSHDDVTTTTTYNKLLYLVCNMDENNHYDIWKFTLNSWNGNYIAPSLFAKFDFTLTSFDGLTHNFTMSTDTISSEFTNEPIYYVELNTATIFAADDYVRSMNCDVTFYFVSTLPYDPKEMENDDYQSGYDDGLEIGFHQGYDMGYDSGKIDGYNNGYTDGYVEGNYTGYNNGYNAGSQNGVKFINLFASIADTPVLMIRRLFGFELFGTSLLTIFMSLLTALIVIGMIKKFFK